MPIPADQMDVAAALLRQHEDKVPVEVLDKVKLCHRTEGNSIVLFNFRQRLMEPGGFYEEQIAKFKYVQSRDRWQLFWMDSTFKWIRYPNLPEADTFPELFAEVQADPLCFFWG